MFRLTERISCTIKFRFEGMIILYKEKTENILVLRPTMTKEEMFQLLLQRGYVGEDDKDHLERITKSARELHYRRVDIEGDIQFVKPVFSPTDIKALMWIQEHNGSVLFQQGYIRFNEDGSINEHMVCPFQDYVIVEIGFKKITAKTITEATLRLQEGYFGTKWSKELQAELYRD
jgi:hypothetical protein